MKSSISAMLISAIIGGTLSTVAYAQDKTDSQLPDVIITDEQARNIAAIDGHELPNTSTFSSGASKNWKVQVLNEIYMNEGEYRDRSSNSKVTSYTEPKFSYKVTPNSYLEVAVPFDVNSIPDKTERADNVQQEVKNGKAFNGTRLSNLWFGATHTGGKIFASDDIVTWLRYYLPTSEVAQELKQDGMLRLDVQVPWTVGKWNFLYLLNPRLYLSHDETTNRQARLSFRQYGLVTYGFTNAFSMYTSYGHKLNSNSDNFLYNQQVIHAFESGASYVFNPNVNVTFYVTDEFVEGSETIQLFTPNKNNMTLATVLSF
ncbi:hypothetical protein [Bdellovibrio svalbardensis]|uniref:Uncharacterized protein n=1 Tax=Bdellovibrio svalbardensis TaxID=2972972 RepID=A0ABT6DL06_9BACT|nr:hypothetical protein [Bdellovibrio svalbardensis]MDG0816574.1 hypothetical protein [Bdellovibrio svalbardensis]